MSPAISNPSVNSKTLKLDLSLSKSSLGLVFDNSYAEPNNTPNVSSLFNHPPKTTFISVPGNENVKEGVSQSTKFPGESQNQTRIVKQIGLSATNEYNLPPKRIPDPKVSKEIQKYMKKRKLEEKRKLQQTKHELEIIRRKVLLINARKNLSYSNLMKCVADSVSSK